jgi:hypothetical protein
LKQANETGCIEVVEVLFLQRTNVNNPKTASDMRNKILVDASPPPNISYTSEQIKEIFASHKKKTTRTINMSSQSSDKQILGN